VEAETVRGEGRPSFSGSREEDTKKTLQIRSAEEERRASELGWGSRGGEGVVTQQTKASFCRKADKKIRLVRGGDHVELGERRAERHKNASASTRSVLEHEKAVACGAATYPSIRGEQEEIAPRKSR